MLAAQGRHVTSEHPYGVCCESTSPPPETAFKESSASVNEALKLNSDAPGELDAQAEMCLCPHNLIASPSALPTSMSNADIGLCMFAGHHGRNLEKLNMRPTWSA